MSIHETKREIYEYLNRVGRAELDEIIEELDNYSANSVYGAAKHLKWDGYLGADVGNNEWWIENEIPGICPQCGDETKYDDSTLELCNCGWTETWACSECGEKNTTQCSQQTAK